MKLLHAADLHLDSPLTGLAAYENAPLGQLRFASRASLSNLVDTAIEEAVDVVLLAGDIFDGDWPHFGTGLHFVSEIARLREAGTPVVMIAGNHDAESKLTRSLRWPANLHVLGTRTPETVVFNEIGLAVHGQGFATPAIIDDLSAGYPAPRRDLINVGLLHTSANGRPGHERYAPCKVANLVQHGYEFWALGHVHRHEVLCADPLIVFPGNLQGRGLRETGPKGALLVEIVEGKSSFKHRALDTVRWETIDVVADGGASRDEVCELVADAVRDASRTAGDRLLVAQVVIRGETEAHVALAVNEERLYYEVIAAATDVAGSDVWIESVKIRTTPLRPLAQAGDDALGELMHELEELAETDGSLEELAGVLAPLTSALPPTVLAEFDPRDPETLQALLDEVARALPIALLDSDAA